MPNKLISLLVCIILIISLSACSKERQKPSENSALQETPELITENNTIQEQSEAEIEDKTELHNNEIESENTVESNSNFKSDKDTTPNNTTNNSNPTTHHHSYSNATCSSPKQCSCGATKGIALGHQFSNATCTNPQICDRCGESKGNALGHKYSTATCTYPRICSRCANTQGSALGHNYVNGMCSRCSKTDPNSLPVSLGDITCIDSYNYSYWSSITDTYGNFYNNCNYFSNHSSSYAVFYLGGNYTNFSCDIIGHQNMASSGVAIIEFYIDGELMRTVNNYTRTTGKVNVKFNTYGGDKLTVKVYRTGGLAGGNIGLVNTKLSK